MRDGPEDFPENFTGKIPAGLFPEKFQKKSEIKISHDPIRTKTPLAPHKITPQNPLPKALYNPSNPGTQWPPMYQNSQTKPKLNPDLLQITPCLIENSWRNCMNRGSGVFANSFLIH